MSETTDKIVIINHTVRELQMPLGAYSGRILAKQGGPGQKLETLPQIEFVRFMPGINLPMFSAVIGQERRALTADEMATVLKSEHMKRLTDSGTIQVTDELGKIGITERAKLASNSADVVCLKAWRGQEDNEKVKAQIDAQITEIQTTRPDGDYRDVKAERNADAASPGF